MKLRIFDGSPFFTELRGAMAAFADAVQPLCLRMVLSPPFGVHSRTAGTLAAGGFQASPAGGFFGPWRTDVARNEAAPAKSPPSVGSFNPFLEIRRALLRARQAAEAFRTELLERAEPRAIEFRRNELAGV